MVRHLFPHASNWYVELAKIYHWVRIRKHALVYILRGVPFFYPKQPNPAAGYYSQYGQDYYLEYLGVLPSTGFFVDVGANRPVLGSNSFYLERIKGWHGVAIDAIDYEDEYRRIRPNTRFFHCAIDNCSESVILYTAENSSGWEDQVSSVNSSITRHGARFRISKKAVNAKRICDLSDDWPPIDLLMIDVEGHELSVLSSIDWVHRPPSVIVCENNGQYFAQRKLEEFVTGKGYKLIARIGASDDIYLKVA